MKTRITAMTAAFAIATTLGAEAGERTRPANMTVCVTFSQALEMNASLKTPVLAELNRIWQPMGITVEETEKFQNNCDRWILLKSALEAGPEDAAGQTAIAWVPFVEKRARRVVFVRMNHARTLIEAFNPTNMLRPPSQTEALLAKLVGRSLAHELGHVLLNSMAHERSGLMRARYQTHDVMHDLPSGYTLNAGQLDRLFAAR